MKKNSQPDNTADSMDDADAGGAGAPLLPGTEKARSLGDLMREAEKQIADEQSTRTQSTDTHSASTQDTNPQVNDDTRASGSTPATRRNKKISRSQARRFARERALQALYQWDVSDAQSSSVKNEFLAGQDMSRVDVEYFKVVFDGVSHHPDKYDELIKPCLDRPLPDLDPIERAVLRIATFELSEQPDIPARVVINEGIEITKRFGADKGHRYVNGVLDKLALNLRPLEMKPSASR